MKEKDLSQIFTGYKEEEGEIIPLLQRAQEKLGYISEEAIEQISKFLKISENQVYGIASFYSQFRFYPPGKNSIKVCLGTACHVRGGQILCEAVQRELGVIPGQTTQDRKFELQRVACLGCCALAPVVQVNEEIHSRMTVIRLKSILDKYE